LPQKESLSFVNSFFLTLPTKGTSRLPPKDFQLLMVISLIFISIFSGIVATTLAVYASLGLMMCIAAYIVGGMVGTVGFIIFTALRYGAAQAPALHPQQVNPTQQANSSLPEHNAHKMNQSMSN
jgi:hypothetical protein